MTHDLFTYPKSPGFKERGSTSESAARSLGGKAKTLGESVLAALQLNPGITDEVAARLGSSILSIRPRFSELRANGKIVPGRLHPR